MKYVTLTFAKRSNALTYMYFSVFRFHYANELRLERLYLADWQINEAAAAVFALADLNLLLLL